MATADLHEYFLLRQESFLRHSDNPDSDKEEYLIKA
jgi:hypothetical protein